jgi:O-antigen ligase
MSRIELMKIAPQVWRMRPWFGTGLGGPNFYIYSERVLPTELGRDHVIHNSYLQMLVHGGIFAFLIFTYMVFGTLWRMARSASQMKKWRPELEAYPRAIEGSLVAFAVASLTHPRATFDFFYMVVAYAAAWHVISRELKVGPTVDAVPALPGNGRGEAVPNAAAAH